MNILKPENRTRAPIDVCLHVLSPSAWSSPESVWAGKDYSALQHLEMPESSHHKNDYWLQGGRGMFIRLLDSVSAEVQNYFSP